MEQTGPVERFMQSDFTNETCEAAIEHIQWLTAQRDFFKNGAPPDRGDESNIVEIYNRSWKCRCENRFFKVISKDIDPEGTARLYCSDCNKVVDSMVISVDTDSGNGTPSGER